MNEWNKDDLIYYAAGHFLSHPLPDAWAQLPKHQLMQIVSQNVWYPFENHSPEEVWELIIDMAVDLNLTFVLGAQIYEDN